ncbi:hypothetical protein [Streptomyces sp. NPDC002602]|uniref:hypothetical protein n=1 Tax=Streptomyces sp. NPDC002602 TaxID=3364654 RepID=UPI003685415E
MAVLHKATFPHATVWGYWNATTPLNPSGRVVVPASPDLAAGDTVELSWAAFSSLNASGRPIAGTELTLTQAAGAGQDLVFEIPYAGHISPLDRSSGSGRVTYRALRAGEEIGTAAPALVKIDLVVPGQ